ncbi:hypothetical protein HYQ46_012399 [Verticillium longisporum]|nr:hypothetical protein HYQ46_012399 [Verticillium longisporum]
MGNLTAEKVTVVVGHLLELLPCFRVLGCEGTTIENVLFAVESKGLTKVVSLNFQVLLRDANQRVTNS